MEVFLKKLIALVVSLVHIMAIPPGGADLIDPGSSTKSRVRKLLYNLIKTSKNFN